MFLLYVKKNLSLYIIDKINNHINSLSTDSVENIILALNYFVDLYAIKPFNAHNDTLVYLVLYLLL